MIEASIDALLQQSGARLYDTQIVTENDETIYRVYVYVPGGVSLDQCVTFTHLISPLLDVTPPMQSAYRLEVSSPGIERALKRFEHFIYSVGENIALVLKDKSKVRGKLLSADDASQTLQIESETGVQTVKFDQVAKAKTYFEW